MITKSRKRLRRSSPGLPIFANILIAGEIICGTIPVLLVVVMVRMLTLGEMTTNKLCIFSLIIAGCLVIKGVLHGFSIWWVHNAAYEVLVDIRLKMINHLKKLPIGFFQKRKIGDLTNIINHDVEQVELYLAHALPEILSATLLPLIVLLVVVCLDWRLGLALFSTAPLMFLLRKILDRFWSKSIIHYTQSTRKMSEDLLEYIAAIPVIKAFSKEEQKTAKLLYDMNAYITWVKRWVFSLTIPLCFISMMLEGGLVVMAIAGSIFLSRGDIELQTFILSLILGGIFSTSFAQSATYQHYKIVYNRALKSINSVMAYEPCEKISQPANYQSGDISFSDVHFSYPGKGETLSGVNLVFKNNSVNAILGASGSGKSTIAHLISGFWKPDKGKITINNNSIGETRLSELVAIAQQEVFLFNLTIEENIRIAKQEASLEEVISSAKKACVHDFISSLPQGYNTIVGEAGVKLSGGEKQRISLARIFLKDSPIIILDEATAAVDARNERHIRENIFKLGKDKIIITIAHHLNTIINVDQIIVMESGKVVAAGKHHQLKKGCRLYAEMISCQEKADNWQIRQVRP